MGCRYLSAAEQSELSKDLFCIWSRSEYRSACSICFRNSTILVFVSPGSFSCFSLLLLLTCQVVSVTVVRKSSSKFLCELINVASLEHDSVA